MSEHLYQMNPQQRRGAGLCAAHGGWRAGRSVLACVRFLILTLPLTFLAAAPVAAGATIPAAERQVLVNVYNSTNGGSWTSNEGWCVSACPSSGAHAFNSAGSECTWYGITCDPDKSHVVAIALSHNNLGGGLPDLGGLSFLRYFAANGNQLGGSIPPLAGMTQLQTFYATDNALTGPIPSLSGMVKLGDMAVDNNRLDGSLPSLSGLANLYHFSAAGNRLGGAIPSLAGLTALREFDVSDNGLTGMIPSVSASTNLLRFAVNRNRLAGAIPVLPASLHSLEVGANALTGAVPAAPASLYVPRALAPSSLCPNPLSTTSGSNDSAWNMASGFSPWWATPLPSNLCDNLFLGAFENQP